jgi:hypothetical protein
MCLTILGAESLGVRSLCCLVKTADRRILIDPGIALGYVRYGSFPQPLQVTVGWTIRRRILRALDEATSLAHESGHPDLEGLVTPAPRCHACPVALCATCHYGRNCEREPWSTWLDDAIGPLDQ